MVRIIVVNFIRIVLFLIIFGLGMLFDRVLLKRFPHAAAAHATQTLLEGSGKNLTQNASQANPTRTRKLALRHKTSDTQVEDDSQKKTDRLYIVKQGDTAIELAKHFGVSLKAIIEANSHIPNIARIRTGTALRIPSSTQATKTQVE